MKQVQIILDALAEYGPMTTSEILSCVEEDHPSLTIAKISAYCSDLFSGGVLDRKENYRRYARLDNHGAVGHASHLYRIKEQKSRSAA